MDNTDILKKRLEEVYKEPSLWEQQVIKTDDLTEVEKKSPEIEWMLKLGDSNYIWFFEQLKFELEREPSVNDYQCLYLKLLEDLNEMLINNTTAIIMEEASSNLFDPFLDIVNSYEKEKLKLDIVFNEYIASLGTPIDMIIKQFPNGLSNKEKNILNYLANKFYIKRNLTANGLFPLFGRSLTKRLLEEFYKYAPEYKDFQAFNFIKSSIETNLPDATLQNYCREVRKDTVKI